MRGGAIPLLAWGTLLLVLCIINWIWNARAVSAATAAFAAVVIYAFALVLWLARRESIRRGPPPPPTDPEGVPDHSVAGVLVGLSVAAILFGLVWANFLVYFGAALLVASLGRLFVELRAQRASHGRTDPGRRE
jgi:hypothetical protein